MCSYTSVIDVCVCCVCVAHFPKHTHGFHFVFNRIHHIHHFIHLSVYGAVSISLFTVCTLGTFVQMILMPDLCQSAIIIAYMDVMRVHFGVQSMEKKYLHTNKWPKTHVHK